jgi:hypothetical protein
VTASATVNNNVTALPTASPAGQMHCIRLCPLCRHACTLHMQCNLKIYPAYLEAAHNQAPGAHSRQLRAAGSNSTPGHGLVGEHHVVSFCAS